MSKEVLTPISELVGYRDENLSWGLTLPEYVPSDEIGVNLPRIHRYLRLAGLDHLTVSSYDGEQTQHQVGVSGVDSQGNATAGISSVITKAPLQKTDLDANDEFLYKLYPEYFWADGRIAVNTTELNRKLLRDGNLRNKVDWATQLNSVVRSGLREAGKEQLIKNCFKPSASLFGGIALFDLSLTVFGGHSVEFLVLSVAYLSFAWQALDVLAAKYRHGLPISERRISAFPEGLQLDRYVVLEGLTRATNLIKPINMK